MSNDFSGKGETTFHLTCRRIVRALIEKYDWALLSEDELVESVLGSVEAEVPPAEVNRLAKHHYSVALYEACRQTENPDRRERGYYELRRFLLQAAYNRWPDLAEDEVQRALILVHEQIGQCRSPGTFLAFALGKLRHAFKQEWRARGKEAIEPESGPGGTERDGAEAWTCLDDQERCQMLLEAVQRLPNDVARKTILLKYFGGLSDAEIGERLGIATNHVRVLRRRSIARLQEDRHLIGYFDITRLLPMAESIVPFEEYEASYEPFYAVARVIDQRRNQPFVLGMEYILQAGIRRETLPGFEESLVWLPSQKSEIEVEVAVYAEDMHIEPDWVQQLVFRKDEDAKSDLLIFRLIPLRVGHKGIRVEFYYQQHWLACIKFEVEVIEVQELVPA